MTKEVDIKEAEQLYHTFIESYFPKDEVKPFSHIERMMKDGHYKVIAFYGDQACASPDGCALLTSAPACPAFLLDYLAVKEAARSRGIGGKLLAAVAGEYAGGRPVLIETESLESARSQEERTQRNRRNAFYRRNGARMTGVKTSVFGVEYTIWVLPASAEEDDRSARENLRGLYHYMLPDALYEQYVRI